MTVDKKVVSYVPNELREKMETSRKKLRNEKPRVYEKLMDWLEGEKKIETRKMNLLDFAYSFECNFNCKHCCADFLQKQTIATKMQLQDVERVADEADKMGVFVFSLIGGEPLVWKDLDELVRVIDPKRFLISITTNGWLLNETMANHLVEIGVNKVNISIDSSIEEEHDAFRNRVGSLKQAIQAVKNGQKAGLNVQISVVATHQNIHTKGFLGVFELSKELGVGIDIQVATPSGKWLGNVDCLVNEEDANEINNLKNLYPLLRRDVFSTPDAMGGCPAVTNSLYIIPSGEVLPCLFIHITLGNILKESLSDIRERGLKIKELREYSPVCLAGEKCDFFDKYMINTFNHSTFPLSYNEGFDVE